MHPSYRICAIILITIAFAGRDAHAQWVQTAGPEGGATAALFRDGADLYAGMWGNAGVFKSTDDGLTWTQKINGMGYQSVSVIRRSGSYLLASGTVGLYRSTDGGESWTTASGLSGGSGVSTLLIDGATLYAGTSGKGIYVSTDDGGTWAAANTNLPNSFGYTYTGGIVKGASGILASVTDNSTYGVYRSTDAGGTWTKIDNGLPAYTQLAALLKDGSTIYGGGPTIYKSTDDGATWTASDAGFVYGAGVEEFAMSGPNYFAATSVDVYRSTDGGANWTPLGGGLPVMAKTALAVSGSTVFVGTIANGVYASTDDGDSWTQRVVGLYGRDMTDPAIDNGTLYWNGNGIFATTDGGGSWQNVRGNLPDSSAQPTLVYANGATMFCRNYPATGMARSTDGGVTWAQSDFADNGLPAFSTVTSMIETGGALFTPVNSIYRSTNNGDSWSRADSMIGTAYMTGITKVNGTIFAYGLGIARSTDNGATWTRADTGIPEYFGITGVAAVGATLFTGGGYPPTNYKSTNNGDTWTPIATLPSSSSATQFLAYGNDLFVCGQNNGIFISTNLGANWTRISTGLPTPNFRYTFAIHNGTMYAGTSGNSVWKRPLSQVTAVEPFDSRIPAGYALNANFPNPFNPSTEVRFDIAGTEHVRLEVYDVLGRLTALLIDERLTPGSYSVTWNATGVPAGAYYLRMSAGAFSATGRMLYVK